MELWLAGLWTAGGWQHMQLDPRAPGEGTHAHAAIAAELGLWRKGLYGSAARPKAASRA
jgi:hypothetical protein